MSLRDLIPWNASDRAWHHGTPGHGEINAVSLVELEQLRSLHSHTQRIPFFTNLSESESESEQHTSRNIKNRPLLGERCSAHTYVILCENLIRPPELPDLQSNCETKKCLLGRASWAFAGMTQTRPGWSNATNGIKVAQPHILFDEHITSSVKTTRTGTLVRLNKHCWKEEPRTTQNQVNQCKSIHFILKF